MKYPRFPEFVRQSDQKTTMFSRSFRKAGRTSYLLVLCFVALISCARGESEHPSATNSPTNILGSASSTAATPAPSTRIPIDHVFVIVLENESYDRTFGDDRGSGGEPCMKALAKRGVMLTWYYGIGHNSMDNYIAMISGQSPNPITQQDCPVFAPFVHTPKQILDLRTRLTTLEDKVNADDEEHRDVRSDWKTVLKAYAKAFLESPDVVRHGLDKDGQAVGAGCVYPPSVLTIADQFRNTNERRKANNGGKTALSWKAYMEGMTGHCWHPKLNEFDPTYTAKGDQYATRHNPFAYFQSLIGEGNTHTGDCDEYDIPLGTGDASEKEGLARDLQTEQSTPNYVFITPNLCNDGHNDPCVNESQAPGHRASGFPAIYGFLNKWVPLIEQSPAFKDGGALIITFDEADVPKEFDVKADVYLAHHIHDGTSEWTRNASFCCGENIHPGPNTEKPGLAGFGGGRIGTIVLSPYVNPGTSAATQYNHYGLLASLEDQFGLERLGFAKQVDSTMFHDPAIFDNTKREMPIDIPQECKSAVEAHGL